MPTINYPGQHCAVARALEGLGERWTLLIVRDAFYGLRRFSDFVDHLDIPRAVLTARLKALEDEGVIARVPGPGKRAEYELTEKGLGLWPIVRGLMAWGDQYYSPAGPVRRLRHAADDGELDPDGRCAICHEIAPAADTVIERGPGWGHDGLRTDPVSASISHPHRLLDAVRTRQSA